MRKKSRLRDAFHIVRLSLSAWADSPRIPFVLLCIALMCFGVLREVGEGVRAYSSFISAAEAPLIVLYRQHLLSGALFLLLMTDLPRKGRAQNDQMIRTDRLGWLLGQIGYCLSMTVIFLLVLIILSLLAAVPCLRFTDQWSDTVRETELFLPETSAMFPLVSRQSLTPYAALGYSAVLSLLYWLGLGLLILFGGLLGQALYGIIPAMAVQLLPWMIDTFSMVPVDWFPGFYANIFHRIYQKGMNWAPALCFLLFDAWMFALMLWRVRKADFAFFTSQGGASV